MGCRNSSVEGGTARTWLACNETKWYCVDRDHACRSGPHRNLPRCYLRSTLWSGGISMFAAMSSCEQSWDESIWPAQTGCLMGVQRGRASRRMVVEAGEELACAGEVQKACNTETWQKGQMSKCTLNMLSCPAWMPVGASLVTSHTSVGEALFWLKPLGPVPARGFP